MELDHFFVLTDRLAPEGELLTDSGLIEGSPNDHPGQGTANRRFFFANTALELLYVRDADEANDGPARGLCFPERASNPDASPFGVVLRPDGGSAFERFPGWRYQPLYFEPGVSFLVGENSERLDEPLCICMPETLRPRSSERRSAPPFSEVTELRLHVPVAEPSSVLEAVGHVERIRILANRSHLMEIVFGHATDGKQRDFRPRLPLKLLW